MEALVGADRNAASRRAEIRERAFLSGWQRLLDQHHLGGMAGGEIGFETGFIPGFVGVGDQRGVGRAARARPRCAQDSGAPELHLEERAFGCFARGGFHSFGRAEASG